MFPFPTEMVPIAELEPVPNLAPILWHF